MRIIDAHAHVFEYVAGYTSKGEFRPIGNGVCRWADGDTMNVIPEGYGEVGFEVESLLKVMDENKVDKAILLQGSLYGFQNEYGVKSAAAHPDRFKAAITLDPFANNALEILERYITAYDVRIFKFELSNGAGLMGYHQDFIIDSEIMDRLYRRIAEINDATLVLDIGSPAMSSCQPEAVYRLAKKYPALKIVVCHLLAPSPADADAIAKALPYLKHDNVWVDLSALPWNVAPEAYPFPSAQAYIKMGADILGIDKLVWGTDTPAVLTKDSYQDLINFIVESGDYNQDELDMIFYGNAATAYNFK